jgi:hypothetical protein
VGKKLTTFILCLTLGIAYARAQQSGGGGGTSTGGAGALATDTFVTNTVNADLPNSQALSALATGILKNTTGTGIASIAVAGDFPTLNQNTTGSSAKWTTPRLLAGNSVDGSADVAFANKFLVQGTADSGLSAAQFMGALGTGLVINTTTTGVQSIYAGATCTNQFPTALSASGAVTCTTATSAYVDTSIWTGTVAAGSLLKSSSQGVAAAAVSGDLPGGPYCATAGCTISGNLAFSTLNSTITGSSSTIKFGGTFALAGANNTIDFNNQNNNATFWRVNNGPLITPTDNTYDIGASGATRPRTAYIATSVITPIFGDAANASRARTSCATPGSLANGDWWVDTAAGNCTTAATTISIKTQNNAVTRTIASVTF